MPAFLWHHLVLEMDRGYAGGLVLARGADHVDRVAVPGVGVGHYRDIDRLRDPSGVVDHLGQSHQPDVGATQPRGRAAEPDHISRGEPGLLYQSGTERVVTARREDHLA